MNKKILGPIRELVFIIGVMGIVFSCLVYIVWTMPDSDPPIEETDYERANLCTLSVLIPSIILATIGLHSILKLKKEKISKPPTQ